MGDGSRFPGLQKRRNREKAELLAEEFQRVANLGAKQSGLPRARARMLVDSVMAVSGIAMSPEIGDFMAIWLESRKGLSRNTERAYRSHIKSFREWLGHRDSTPIDRISLQDMQDLL